MNACSDAAMHWHGSRLHQISSTRVELDGKEFTFFGGTNYLGLSFHPVIIGALKAGLDATGLGLGTSRTTTGTSPEIEDLERLTAAFCGTEDAIVTTSGMLSNIAVLEGLSGLVGTWLADEASHHSFRQFVPVGGAPLITYRHCDVTDFRRKLDLIGEEKIGVFTDCVFPLTGRVAPLQDIVGSLDHRNHILVADEAHSIGVLGDHGRGLLDALGVRGGHIIRTATLSKALGCMGGLILGSMSLLDRIRSTASAYSATSALAPALCRAAIAALSVLADDEQRLRRLRENCNLMSAQLTSVPLAKRGPTAPIFCLESGPNRDPGRIHLRCKEKDIFVPLITDYPGTDSKGLLRWIVQADHEADEIESLCSILRSELGVR